MPAALAIPLIVGAGATVASAAIGAHASGKAADQQAASGQQALGVEQQQYANSQRLLAPYQYGGPALAGLNHPVNNQGNGMPPPMLYGAGQTIPQAPKLAGYGYTPNARAMALGGPQAASGASNSGMVTVQAPTGETRQMSSQQAQLAVQHGARIVG